MQIQGSRFSVGYYADNYNNDEDQVDEGQVQDIDQPRPDASLLSIDTFAYAKNSVLNIITKLTERLSDVGLEGDTDQEAVLDSDEDEEGETPISPAYSLSPHFPFGGLDYMVQNQQTKEGHARGDYKFYNHFFVKKNYETAEFYLRSALKSNIETTIICLEDDLKRYVNKYNRLVRRSSHAHKSLPTPHFVSDEKINIQKRHESHAKEGEELINPKEVLMKSVNDLAEIMNGFLLIINTIAKDVSELQDLASKISNQQAKVVQLKDELQQKVY